MIGIAGWGEPRDVFGRLGGAWEMCRTIAGQGTMAGVAIFSAADGGWLRYREQGQLRLENGRELSARGEYLYARADDGFGVFFAEDPPRLFHTVRLTRAGSGLQGPAEHLCGCDVYTSTYEFFPDGSFVIHHAALGPRKDYVMSTRYVRT